MSNWNPKDLSKYNGYDHEMKISVCRCAFEMCADSNFAPHEGIFFLARTIGYQIPEKWRDVHPDMIP